MQTAVGSTSVEASFDDDVVFIFVQGIDARVPLDGNLALAEALIHMGVKVTWVGD